MFANKYKINLKTMNSGSTATTITFPIDMVFQTIDQAELIETVFVDTEVEKAINPILNYDKVRFMPITPDNIKINKLIYNVNLLDDNGQYVNVYGKIGFSDDDIKYKKESFKQTFLDLVFFDTDNALTQVPINNVTIFSNLNTSDLLGPESTNGISGQPKPANEIPINFILEDPILNPRGFSEGYHLYDYKDGLPIGGLKYIYMRATFKNAKTGKAVNLMVTQAPQTIDKLVNELYTRYKLTRKTTGYYYEIDPTYNGNSNSSINNVNYVSNSSIINLYQIKAL